MKLLKFGDFLNESLGELNESLKRGDAHLVGDFSSILLGSTQELRRDVTPNLGRGYPKNFNPI